MIRTTTERFYTYEAARDWLMRRGFQPIPQGGFGSGRARASITYHESDGLRFRVTVSGDDVREAA